MKYLICLFILLAGCSVGSKVESIPLEDSRSYDAAFDATWIAAVEVLTEMNFPIKTIDKSSGLLNTDEVVTAESGVLQDSHLYGVRNFRGSKKEIASLKLLVKSEGQKTKIKLTANIKELGSSGWFNEESKGVLEKMVFDKISERIKQ